MAEFELHADIRSEQGKCAVRRLRRSGRVPAIMYGAGKEPTPIGLAENVIRRQLSNEAFFSHVLTVKVDGHEERAVIKSLQRHPATERILHLDLLRISETQRITMLVPIHFENEEDSPGRRAGGSISHHTTEVEITCLPKDLPEYLSVDTVHMDIGDSIHLSQIPLPEGVEIPALAHGPEHDQPAISIQISRVTEVEEVAEGEEEFDLPLGSEAGPDGDAGEPSGEDG
jgi:large subunit ribosomal protein L25